NHNSCQQNSVKESVYEFRSGTWSVLRFLTLGSHLLSDQGDAFVRTINAAEYAASCNTDIMLTSLSKNYRSIKWRVSHLERRTLSRIGDVAKARYT
ncbi:hypothetical protein BgiBS90_014320, partial [Biomphalaria glabrata]